jgi:hypothetical protein
VKRWGDLMTEAQEIEQRERVIAGLNSQLTDEIAATQALAREVERLTALHAEAFRLAVHNQERAEGAEARVREMEADTKQLGAQAAATLKVRRSAVKAVTIAQCAKVGDAIAKEWREDADGRVAAQPPQYAEANTSNAHANGAEEVAAAIRALANSP